MQPQIWPRFSAMILFTMLHYSPSLIIFIIIITWHRCFDNYAATFAQWWRRVHNQWKVWYPLATPACGYQVLMTALPIYICVYSHSGLYKPFLIGFKGADGSSLVGYYHHQLQQVKHAASMYCFGTMVTGWTVLAEIAVLYLGISSRGYGFKK